MHLYIYIYIHILFNGVRVDGGSYKTVRTGKGFGVGLTKTKTTKLIDRRIKLRCRSCVFTSANKIIYPMIFNNREIDLCCSFERQGRGTLKITALKK